MSLFFYIQLQETVGGEGKVREMSDVRVNVKGGRVEGGVE